MSRLLRRLLAHLRLGAEPGDTPDPGAADLGASPDDQGGGDTLEDLADLQLADDPEPAAPAPRESNEARLQRELEQERAAHRASLQRFPQPTGPAIDPETAAEQAQMAAAKARGATQSELDMLAWTHQSNRTLRESQRNSQAAVRRAEDLHDQTAFEKLEITNPAIYKRYKSRVDEEVAKLQAQGQSAPRTAILRFLIGNDLLEGKLKKSVKSAPAPAVDRGKMPPARTDVSGRRKVQSEREQRRERLRNTPL